MRQLIYIVAVTLFVIGFVIIGVSPMLQKTVRSDSIIMKAVATITTEDMDTRIHILAADSMRGRNTPSPELEKAANYIADEFLRFGLAPGVGDTAFIQRYPFFPDNDAPNVIGVLYGSDPVLRNEYVVFSAHMDHLGVGSQVNSDSIYNGADDNASGTSAIIEIAEAMSRTRFKPRRSMIFLLVSGEEGGLRGSKWFSDHPTVPIGSIVADFNIDMIGRNWRDKIVAIGRRESSLGVVVDSVARANPGLGLDVIDDPWPEQRFYIRSDHYNFARKGVPILFFFSGVHEDYHQVSDESHTIDFEKAARIARLVALTGWAVANADERPQWDPDAFARIVDKAIQEEQKR